MTEVRTVFWFVEDLKIKHGPITANPSCIFFIVPANIDLADFIEGIRGWLRKNNCQLTRIMTVINCRSLYENDTHNNWYDAAIHFSDMVLINKREGVITASIDPKVAKKFRSIIPSLESN